MKEKTLGGMSMKRIKKMLFCLMLLLSFSMVIPAQAQAAVKINKKTASVNVGKTVQLKISGTKKKVKWSTSKKSVATVTQKGKVTGKKKGTATITAKIGSKKYTCKVTVKAAPTVALSDKKKTLTAGQSFDLALKNTKSSAKWSTNNKNVAAIKKISKYKYKVTAKKAGTATITATVGKKKYSCKVTVKAVKNNNDQNITLGQKNALRAAKEYLKYYACSYNMLVENLLDAKYLRSEAVYAAENCGADWNKQAMICAEEYLEFMPYSYNGLVEQLMYSMFTAEQARYGASNCNVDWNKQALEMAKNYLECNVGYSRKWLIENLIEDGFTQEQAIYGSDNLNVNWNKQAAVAAKNYLEYSAYSKAELIETLEDDGFTHSEAVYGAEAVGY